MSLSDVHYQGFAQRVLQRAVRAGRIAHAYLFYGMEGVGRELFSRGLAELLLCGTPEEHALPVERREDIGGERLVQGCGKCADCRLARADAHPDLHVVHRRLVKDHPDADVRKSKALKLGVDVIRTFMIEPLGLTAQRGRRKVFIVREAERMNAAAQNALLKTLEEPPGDAVILLLAAQVEPLLVTTRSRCQEIRFDPLPRAFVAARLSAARPDMKTNEVEWYAQFAAGSLGRAMEHAADRLFEANAQLAEVLAGSEHSWSRELVELWKKLGEDLGNRYAAREPDATDTETQRVAYQLLFRLTAQWFADALHLCVGEEEQVLNTAWKKELQDSARRRGERELTSAIRRLAEAERQVDANAYLSLCVDSLINDLTPSRRGGVRVG